jgi:two-component system sensor histidine kinase SenX3
MGALVTAAEATATVLAAGGLLVAASCFVALRRVRSAGEHEVEAAAGRRRDAEARAATAEAVLTAAGAALDEAEDGIVVVDRTGREILRNAAAASLASARTAEVLAGDVLEELLDLALAGREAARELRLFGPPPRVLRLRAVPLRREGEVAGAVVFVRDVTDARRIEAVRRDFVANVSHELKTPVGALALLAETIGGTDDPVQLRPLADRLAREADRLARIIDDLLDLSTIEASEQPVRTAVAARALVSESAGLVETAASRAGVTVHVGGEPSGVVVCDPKQVRTALVNLLDNAIKYSEPGGSVEFDARVAGERVAFSVRDHGIGIPSRDLDRVFERFYRVDRARSRDTGGTGLGLSIVRHVADAHGGEITVESREGEGSEFTLYLPRADVPDPSPGGHRPEA